MYVAILT